MIKVYVLEKLYSMRSLDDIETRKLTREFDDADEDDAEEFVGVMRKNAFDVVVSYEN